MNNTQFIWRLFVSFVMQHAKGEKVYVTGNCFIAMILWLRRYEKTLLFYEVWIKAKIARERAIEIFNRKRNIGKVVDIINQTSTTTIWDESFMILLCPKVSIIAAWFQTWEMFPIRTIPSKTILPKSIVDTISWIAERNLSWWTLLLFGNVLYIHCF